jgi:hypothetical protein
MWGPQRIALEHHADVPSMDRDLGLGGAVDDDVVAEQDASLVGGLETGDAAQGGRLATAARAEQSEELALLHREVEVLHHHCPPVGLDQSMQ